MATGMSSHNISLEAFFLDINRNLSDTFFITSLISVVFVMIVVASFVFVPRLRRHPAQLLFHRTLLDLIICLCHIFTYTFINHDGNPLENTDSINDKCRPVAFFYQVALFGSNSWYFVLSVDLFLAVRNPFSCHSDYLPYYYIFVYSSSLLTGFVLVFGQYGLTVFNYCWVRDGLVIPGKANMSVSSLGDGVAKTASNWVWGIYYGPHLILCIVSIAVVIFATVALTRGLPASGETRRQVVRFGFFYVLAFAIEWTLRLALYLSLDKYLIDKALDDPVSYKTQLHNVAAVFAVVEGLRGVVDFFLWFGTGSLTLKEVQYRSRRVWAKWTGKELDDSGKSLQAPLIDGGGMEVTSVLRHDMITCTSWGIVDTAPVDMRPANLSVTGFEDTLRMSTVLPRMALEDEDKPHAPRPVSPADSLNLQLGGFEAQRSELRLWLKSTEAVRNRRIHCPTALQSTTFDFRDFAPDVFSCIRSLRGVDPITYCQSFNATRSKGNSAMLEKFTEGRSGSFFYFTHDSRYIVKTVTDSETALLNRCVRDYFFHLHSNPDSLLTRFFGLHAMRLSPEQKFISLMVMENIFPVADALKPTERYDLKGSWVSRRTLKGKNANVPLSKLTLKDSDLKRKIRIGPEAKARLLAQLRKDVGFLSSLGIMDYSLLIGIRDFESDPRQALPEMVQASHSQRGHLTSTSRRRDPGQSLGYVPPSPMASQSTFAPGGSMRVDPPSFTPVSATLQQEVPESTTPWHRRFHGGLLSLPPKPGDTAMDDSSITESALHDLGGPGAAESVAREEKVWSIYYMGLIDILQCYNFSKKVEHFFKANIRCMDSRGISAVNVNDYADRFMSAMDKIFV